MQFAELATMIIQNKSLKLSLGIDLGVDDQASRHFRNRLRILIFYREFNSHGSLSRAIASKDSPGAIVGVEIDLSIVGRESIDQLVMRRFLKGLKFQRS